MDFILYLLFWTFFFERNSSYCDDTLSNVNVNG